MTLLAMAAIACDPGEAVHIENRTDQTVLVFENGNKIHQIAPGGSERYLVLEFEGVFTYEVRTIGGSVLARRTFTWDEIHNGNGISMIVQNGQSPQPGATQTTPTATPQTSPAGQ
jgi:hypothetical protein